MDKDKDERYVTHYHLERRLEPIEKDVNKLEKVFPLLQQTLDTLSSNVARMVKTNEETNENLQKISIQAERHEIKIKNLQEKSVSYDQYINQSETASTQARASMIVAFISTIGLILVAIIGLAPLIF